MDKLITLPPRLYHCDMHRGAHVLLSRLIGILASGRCCQDIENGEKVNSKC